MLLHHFSEDPTIEVFEPHVPATNPTQAPAVWAIDADHAPLYWFPRDCPRVTVWPSDDAELFRSTFGTTAPRLHVMEFVWVERMASTQLHRYDFDASSFRPWADAEGQWIARSTVRPVSSGPVGDLFGLHADAGIELRLLPSLDEIEGLAVDDRWNFSLVRMANAGCGPTS